MWSPIIIRRGVMRTNLRLKSLTSQTNNSLHLLFLFSDPMTGPIEDERKMKNVKKISHDCCVFGKNAYFSNTIRKNINGVLPANKCTHHLFFSLLFFYFFNKGGDFIQRKINVQIKVKILKWTLQSQTSVNLKVVVSIKCWKAISFILLLQIFLKWLFVGIDQPMPLLLFHSSLSFFLS